ncbi:MFS transporter [Hyphomicrobium sp.]|uniref:MFS transporter n=1 Tax=Hyphomicrobium sp. TaxID=82 RepID=UPI000FBE0061|nr:MFS transporter [Hyphomicrobium sp.]RUO98269.1 MAG: MFS transporter [Hyphomicrobium sp.]
MQREAPIRITASSSKTSARGLDYFSFFLADAQTGFGPFLTVYLTSEKWPNADIGLLLTVGSLVGLIGQIPAGAIIDATRRERLIAAIAVAGVGLSALAIALSSQFLFTVFAQVLHVAASVFIGPALAAISLALVGHLNLGARLGRNAQFASAGSMFATVVMGACGYFLSNRAVFFLTAAMTVPALVAILFVSPNRPHIGHADYKGQANYSLRRALVSLTTDRGFLILSLCVFFFHLANAGLMPLAASLITMRSEQWATVLVAMCLILPQIVVTLGSGRVGALADDHGRRPLLLIAFASLGLRAFLFGFCREPYGFVILQILDGIAAAIIGIIVAVCVADLTQRSNNFNVGLGVTGAAMGLGAAISTTLTGEIADLAGSSIAFFAMAAVALFGMTIVGRYMPETRSTIESK